MPTAIVEAPLARGGPATSRGLSAAAAAPVKTHCPYCALQCGLLLTRAGGADPLAAPLRVDPWPDFPVTKGGLCLKGWTAAETLNHPERLRTPLIRHNGSLVEVSWDEALDRIAAGITLVQDLYGKDAVGVLGGGSLTNEKAYLLGKFARVAVGTANVDYNGRFCMSSAAVAATMAFGLDRGLPFPLEDLAQTDVIFLVGGNPAETLPPAMQYFVAQRKRGGAFIVADPRRSATARLATHHLQLTPGSDGILANGLLHLIIRDCLVDHDYIAARTTGFDAVCAAVAPYTPERVAAETGIPELQLGEVACLLARAPRAVILTARGAEQQATGVGNVLALINLALATGRSGRPYSGFGCLTGQGNGQGGREHGQKADQLPGYRRIDDPEHRRHVAAVWAIDETALPGKGLSAYEMLDALGRDVHALLVFGSNPAVSAPNLSHIHERLRAVDLLVVTDFFLSETAALADVVLPAAQWAEEEGTVTNLEGRVIRRRRALDPPSGVLTDDDILCSLAARLGHADRFRFAGPESIFDELRRASAGGPADYAGITYPRIEREHGVFWPCPAEDHPGTLRLFVDRFSTPDGRARFHPVQPGPAAELPDERFPLFLTTGRISAHYQTSTQTRRVPRLVKAAGQPRAELHPALAGRHGLAEGADVWLETRRGHARFRAALTDSIREDTVFVPFHWGGESAANLLTNPALDPTSRMPEFKVCAARITRITGGS